AAAGLSGPNSRLGLKLTGQVYVGARRVSTRLPERPRKMQAFFRHRDCLQRLGEVDRKAVIDGISRGDLIAAKVRLCDRKCASPHETAATINDLPKRRFILPGFPVFPGSPTKSRLPPGAMYRWRRWLARA